MKENKKYKIWILGCHSNTDFEIELNESEFKLVEKISKLSKENSRYGCMPTLEISEVDNDK